MLRPSGISNLYERLGVPPTATENEIKAAYRQTAMEWHPDKRKGDPRAHDDFISITKAYEVLMDIGRRRLYDSELEQAKGSPRTPPAEPEKPFKDYESMNRSARPSQEYVSRREAEKEASKYKIVYKKPGFWERMAYRKFVRAARREGYGEEDLLEDDSNVKYRDVKFEFDEEKMRVVCTYGLETKLEHAVRIELRDTFERRELGPWLTLFSLPAAIIMEISSHKRKFKEKVVPEVPAHQECTTTGGLGILREKVTTCEDVSATPAYTQNVSDGLYIAYPYLHLAAAIMPTAIFLGLCARSMWLNYYEHFIRNEYRIRKIAAKSVRERKVISAAKEREKNSKPADYI